MLGELLMQSATKLRKLHFSILNFDVYFFRHQYHGATESVENQQVSQ